MSTINYTVTVASAKFLIDGAVAPKLTFRDGDTYVFDQADSSNAGHILQFSITSNNSGSSEYTTGVTKAGTPGNAGAKTTIVTSGSTTDTLYYYSSGGGTYGEEFSNSGFNTTSEGILKPIVGAEATAEKWGPMVNHAIDQIVDLTVPKSGGTFSGVVAVPTASAATDTTQVASTAFVRQEVNNLIDTAPSNLDTLNELAAALGDDNDYAASVTTLLGDKAPKANPTFTGTVSMDGNNRLDIGSSAAADIYMGPDDTNQVVRFSKNSAGDLDILTNAATLHIDADGSMYHTGGNVGIGTAAPGASDGVISDTILEVKNPSAVTSNLRVCSTQTRGMNIGIKASSTCYIENDENNAGGIEFRTRVSDSTTTKMFIKGDGNVGIGLTNPGDFFGKELVISSGTGGGITLYSTGTNSQIYFADATSGDGREAGRMIYLHDENSMKFFTNNGERMKIDSSGNIETSTTGKVKQKGAFMQSSTHQALTLGY